MPENSKLKRLFLLMQKIKPDRYVSFNEIKNYLERYDYKGVSVRTLRRDFESLRLEYQVEIVYVKIEDGYTIRTQDSGQHYQHLLGFMQLNQAAEAFRTVSTRSKQFQKWVSFDVGNDFTGYGWIESIIEAIEHQKTITIEHQAFLKAEINAHEVEPYHLKCYKNRWYLVGFSRQRKELRIFGLDRIVELEMGVPYAKPSMLFDHSSYFKDVVGVHKTNAAAISIEIKVIPYVARLLLNLPIHASQNLIQETESYSIFRFFLIPNLEFEMEILQFGDQIEVLKPDAFRMHIQNRLLNALHAYK